VYWQDPIPHGVDDLQVHLNLTSVRLKAQTVLKSLEMKNWHLLVISKHDINSSFYINFMWVAGTVELRSVENIVAYWRYFLHVI